MTVNWIKIGDRKPDNSGQAYPGSACTPFVPCLVWICYPGKPQGGLAQMLRWDVKNDRWDVDDVSVWIYQSPYEITHFSDEKINYPGDPDHVSDFERGAQDAMDNWAQIHDPDY
jgi:hypothetical protein